jgi:hypothetical protein
MYETGMKVQVFSAAPDPGGDVKTQWLDGVVVGGVGLKLLSMPHAGGEYQFTMPG